MLSKRKKTKTVPTASESSSITGRSHSLSRQADARILFYGCRICFVVYSFLFLGLVNKNYLYIVQEFNLFLNNRTFFLSCFDHIGGPLHYVSCFMTQFFDMPFWGALILTLLLLLLHDCTEKLFHLDERFIVLSYLPSFLLIHLFTQPGYRVFDEIMYLDYLYAGVIGTLTALLFALSYTQIKKNSVRFFFAGAGTIFLYYAVGIFGLLGLVLCLLQEGVFPKDARKNLRIEILVLLGLLIPLLFYQLVPTIPFSRIYIAGLPEFYAWNMPYIVFTLLFATILLLALLGLRLSRNHFGSEKRMISCQIFAVNAVMFFFAALATTYFSHANQEFLVTVEMCKKMQNRDWEGILRIDFSDPKPIRPIVLMRHLAQFKLGRIGNEAFRFPQNSKRIKPIEFFSSKFIFGDQILYEYGAVNLAYRAAFNQFISKGANKYHLKLFMLCALANGENDLAQKYRQLLRQSHYRINPMTESEVAQIQQLMPQTNRILELDLMDAMIVDHFMSKEFETSPENVQEMTLFYILLGKDMQRFLQSFECWYGLHKEMEIPRHFQEAILTSSKDIAADTKKYGLSPEIVTKYERFQLLAAKSSEAEQLQKEFGDTFWYFYFQKENLTFY